MLLPETYKAYIDSFNADDCETWVNAIGNAQAWDWLRENVPLFDCPDKQIEQTYYFRWWTFRKHIRETPVGFVVTEFGQEVSWAGKFNTINCPAGHHLYEGRWLRDRRYLEEYARFWFRGGGEPRKYSFWAADALWARHLVAPNEAMLIDLLPDLVANYEAWEKSQRDANGLFWQIDDRDGMECSIGGSGYRATINSYQYGDAMAIAKIAELAGNKPVQERFQNEAGGIKKLVEEKLWDAAAEFFKVAPRGEQIRLVDVRELHGFTPWYFNLPSEQFSGAWKQAMDPNGFAAPCGLATAERRHPDFMRENSHECLWNGPCWPFASSVTLTALANLLNNYHQNVIGKKDYLALLGTYARSQQLKLPDGKIIPWIDENLHPDTGQWLARHKLREHGVKDRARDYNHSTFCDLVISGLVGLRPPRADNVVEVNPLVPEETWDYFCLDRVLYHGHWLTIIYDKTGRHYGREKGLNVYCDDKRIAHANSLQRVTAKLPGDLPLQSQKSPETAAGWKKHSGNPVLGGNHGTCFDLTVLKENDLYRMWFSWRPKKSLALAESRDGIHWSEPRVVLEPEPGTGWEDDINRPSVVKSGGIYHLWYTGQANGKSAIGYATSLDGKTWKRQSAAPVLTAQEPWEKVAVMCPNVLWDAAAKLFRMWYSGGENHEPDAIGYATSPDGRNWTRHPANPVFTADRDLHWENCKVTACHVEKHDGWYVMFYIGFRDVDHAQIGVARSRDGIKGWQRLPDNPIIRPGMGKWDHDACYKPFAICDGGRWLLWYNGRHGAVEQIGLATHEGADLGFPLQ